MKARDVMTWGVISVEADASVERAARLRSKIRREDGTSIVARLSMWVSVRDTVSIVSPR